MAQTDATTLSGDFSGFIKPADAEAYFDEARQRSVVQQLARQVPLGIDGSEVPVTTSKPTASWVSEGGQKPTTEGGKTLRTISPKKLAAISVVSAEVVRKNPGGYMDDLRADIGEAFALAFDAATLHGTNTPFGAGSWIAGTSKSVALGTNSVDDGGIHADVNDGLSLLVNDTPKRRMTGSVWDSIAEPLFNGAVDKNGRPLFIDTPITEQSETIRIGRVLGRPARMADTVASGSIVGFAGDWTKAIWGAVGGISYKVSTEATVTLNGELVSLFEHNLVAVLAEAEFGWLLADDEYFVKYTYQAS